jgi:hypothetical protein
VFLIEMAKMYQVILLNGVWCYREQKYDCEPVYSIYT